MLTRVCRVLLSASVSHLVWFDNPIYVPLGKERVTHHQAEVALGQVDHGGVEVGALIEGGRDDRGREGRRGL